MSQWIRPYSWIDTIFAEEWTEAKLKWFVYQNYESFLDPEMWKFYGPDLARPSELFDETKIFRVKQLITTYKKQLNITKSPDGMSKASCVGGRRKSRTDIGYGAGRLMLCICCPRTFES